MSLVHCKCGHDVDGDDERALLTAAREHIGVEHPDLVGRLSDDDLRQMAQPAEST